MKLEKIEQRTKNLTKDILGRYYSGNFYLKKKSPKFIWILSHMRSGSSLLVHLLNTHPDILGYGETGIRYQNQEQLNWLIGKVGWYYNRFLISEKYILDKILHNKFLKEQELLENKDIVFIFLLREPQATLISLANMFPHRKEHKLLKYYQNRLEKLTEYAQVISDQNRGLLITYDQLINQTDSIFNTFHDFLHINDLFSEEYKLLRWTGKRKIGDTSENIKSGNILRNKKQSNQNISPQLIATGNKAFLDCYNTLSQYLKTI